MSDIVAEITYHIERSGMSDKVTLDVGVLEHWRKEYVALKQENERLRALFKPGDADALLGADDGTNIN